MTYKDPIYEHLKDLTIRKRPWDNHDTGRTTSYEPYRINKLISASTFYLKYAEEANQFKNISKEYHYNFYLSVLPQRSLYFNFPKVKKVDDNVVYHLAKYYEFGRKEAIKMLNTANKEDIQKIINLFDKTLKVG